MHLCISVSIKIFFFKYLQLSMRLQSQPITSRKNIQTFLQLSSACTKV